MITDLQRLEFLQALAKNIRGHNGLLLTEWESQFLGTWLQTSRPSLWFTPGRRSATDRMWQKYGAELELPFKMPAASIVTVIAADPNGCEYLVRPDGDNGRPQGPCNEPAEKMRANGFRYCGTHADQVERDLKRGGKTIHLYPYKKS